MIIDNSISGYIVFEEDSISGALEKIGENKFGAVFAVDESGRIAGILTDGDFRRWAVRTDQILLDTPVNRIMNRNFLSLDINTDPEEIRANFSERIRIIPLTDAAGHLVGIARQDTQRIQIGNFTLSSESPVFIIAEIGNNHNGDIELAKRLVDEAVVAGANCAKFQMRQMKELYRQDNLPENANEDLGVQYTIDLLTRFSLTNDEMFHLFDYCRGKGILPLCTPWDVESLNLLDGYGMEAYKVASADLTNHELLRSIVATRKPMLISTGMSTESEIIQSVQLLKQLGAGFVLLHCNSTYPAPFKDVHLRYMKRLEEISNSLIGYSGHERDINVAIAATGLGARVIEKHFTLDRSMEGNDHKVSLLPDEFCRMVEGIRQVEQALGSCEPRKPTQGEVINRESLAKSLVAAKEIEQGQTITRDMVITRSPGQGLQPNRLNELIGRSACRNLRPGDFFFPSDLKDETVRAAHYSFSRPWGVPVRFHDCREISLQTNLKLLEFHLSYKDMELDFSQFLDDEVDLDYAVHCPELFSGDHILDLCSEDPEYRARSIQELQRVIDLTRKLKSHFKRATKPLIITNVGGFSADNFLGKDRTRLLYEILAESLGKIDSDGVEVIPQTMPPFPWHFGGQHFHNIFVHPESIAQFCKEQNMRICLDLSHSKLACNQYHWSFETFIRQVGPYVAHMHIADASGVDGEGLQIGEGDIDVGSMMRLIDQCVPMPASFIPEVWQGHKNKGEGFWVALHRLESLSERV